MMDIEPLLTYMISNILRSYKTDETTVRTMLISDLQNDIKLTDIIANADEIRFVIRTREFKDFFSKSKKKVYNGLRSYKKSIPLSSDLLSHHYTPEIDAIVVHKLLASHISTRERLCDRDFYNSLFSLIGPVGTVLDIGCGMNPLMIPLNYVSEKIVGVDKDKAVIELLSMYSQWNRNSKICGILWDIKDGWLPILEQSQIDLFDLALMMKVIPVVNRQERSLIPILSRVPAKKILVTGSKNSMTKNSSIYKREKNVIESFITVSGFEKETSVNLTEEFGWIVRRT